MKDKGTISENTAINWLLNQDFEVFKNVSPYGAADLIAKDKAGHLIQIDVKTQSYSKTGHALKYKHNGQKVREKELKGVKILCVNYDGSCRWVHGNILQYPVFEQGSS